MLTPALGQLVRRSPHPRAIPVPMESEPAMLSVFRGGARASGFLEAGADAVGRLRQPDLVVADLELLAQPLDVAVDGAVVDIDLVVIGGVHQRVAALHHAGPGRER